MNKRFEKGENLIKKHQPEIPDNQLINRGKNQNHERSTTHTLQNKQKYTKNI